jgi:hypothetical protein
MIVETTIIQVMVVNVLKPTLQEDLKKKSFDVNEAFANFPGITSPLGLISDHQPEVLEPKVGKRCR